MVNKKWKRGDIHPETGLFYWTRNKNLKNPEMWLTKKRFTKYKISKQKTDLKYHITSDYCKSGKRKKYAKEYYGKNKKKILKYSKEYYNKNREIIRTQQKIHRENRRKQAVK